MLVEGFTAVLGDPILLLMMVAGTAVGIIFGSIPGLTASMAITLCLPITFSMEPIRAIAVLMSLYIGGISGGLISAILLNIPGTPSSIATVFDGSKMAANGHAKRAIGIGVFYSFLGTVFGIVCLLIIAPLLSTVAMNFGALEYAALSIFSLSLVIALAGKDFTKGLIGAILGMIIATVGLAPIDSAKRFLFGSTDLMGGFQLLTLLIGLYAVTEIAGCAEKAVHPDKITLRKLDNSKGFGFTLKEFKDNLSNFITSAIIGVGIGILPGIGGGTSGMMAYTLQKERSKTPEKFGTGCMEGIVAPETANNATIGGAMVPLICLGIPGDGATAMLLGGLMIHSISPGPLIFEKHGELVYAIYAAMLFSAIAMLIIEWFGMHGFVQLLKIPQHYLLPVVILLCCVGAYGSSNRVFDVIGVAAFGVLGYVVTKCKIPIPPLVLGFILGPMFEENLRRSSQYIQNDPGVIWSHPIAVGFIAATVIAFIFFMRSRHKQSQKAQS